MRGLIILFVFNGAGLLLHEWVGVPLPSNVIGMLLLVAALFLKWIKLEWVEESASFFTKHMMLFFAPLIAGVTVFAKELSEAWLSVAISVVGGTIAVMLVTAAVVRLLSPAEAEVQIEAEKAQPSQRPLTKEGHHERGISQ
ncbi:CidA/LrgA family protein [Paenibacillus kobensis]|uniref:CidA/LrgA family protein n=1 Tax=Paenibacillus kobensis TaxID=59841 RepID=UPI0013E34D31|nr:CidA/LrgA family protein [Paenibacillus kobensis]